MVLQAIANHMAIAIEGARTARLELERNALESAKALMTKDLELTSAVQKLFLPGDWASSKGGVELHAAYRPASRCGGDWWWADAHPDGSVTILVGDVTGHGPAPAVITAAIATAYTLLRETYPDRPLDWVLGELNTELLSLSGGTYMMSISAVTIDPRQRSLRCLSAGAPPLLAISSKGAIKPLIVPGTPLGSQILSLGELREPLGEGDRVLIFTDGVSELELPGGKQLGLRRLTKLASGLVEGSVTDAVARLVVELDRLRQETEQQDDMTLVLAGIRA